MWLTTMIKIEKSTLDGYVRRRRGGQQTQFAPWVIGLVLVELVVFAAADCR